MGTLYYGDNLDILRRYLKDESVDLIYLDPPFNSKRDYKDCPHHRRDRGRARNADTNTRDATKRRLRSDRSELEIMTCKPVEQEENHKK